MEKCPNGDFNPVPGVRNEHKKQRSPVAPVALPLPRQPRRSQVSHPAHNEHAGFWRAALAFCLRTRCQWARVPPSRPQDLPATGSQVFWVSKLLPTRISEFANERERGTQRSTYRVTAIDKSPLSWVPPPLWVEWTEDRWSLHRSTLQTTRLHEGPCHP